MTYRWVQPYYCFCLIWVEGWYTENGWQGYAPPTRTGEAWAKMLNGVRL